MMPIHEIPICLSEELGEKSFLIVDIEFYGKPHSAVILRYEGQVYAYLNQCVHMPRTLNCEKENIFDAEKKFLRCSMHGIVYQPESGESQSTLCQGKKLTALRLRETGGKISLIQKHLTLPKTN